MGWWRKAWARYYGWENGSAHDFCRIWEWDPVSFSPLCAAIWPGWSASEATRRPLRTAAQMQKGLVRLALIGNNDYLGNRCSMWPLYHSYKKQRDPLPPLCWLHRREGAAPSAQSLREQRKQKEPKRGICREKWEAEKKGHMEFWGFGYLKPLF